MQILDVDLLPEVEISTGNSAYYPEPNWLTHFHVNRIDSTVNTLPSLLASWASDLMDYQSMELIPA